MPAITTNGRPGSVETERPRASTAARVEFATFERLPDLVEAVIPGVVHVESCGADGQPMGHGSGFTICPCPKDEGTSVVATNAHVIHGGETFVVRFYDDSEHTATLRYSDDSTDLALLEVAEPPLRTLELRSLREVRIGEPVMAIGSPYGLSGTVTIGIVSGLDRTISAPNQIPIDNAIQTDALINPGNSGGPLIGFDGRVIGVNDQVRLSERFGDPTGMAFAIPADTVQMIHDEICTDGRVRRATIGAGLQLRPFTPDEKRQWRQKAGALIVMDPAEESPAGTAGLRRGDVIVRLDDHVIDEPGDAYRLLDRSRIERPCEVAFIRDGSLQQTIVTPAERE